MKVLRVDLLERSLSEDGRCVGKARVSLEGGEYVIVDCDFEFGGCGQSQLNGAFAFEAVRQIKRLPEHIKSSVEFAANSVPQKADYIL